MSRRLLIPFPFAVAMALAGASPQARADMVYLAVGDSSAFGETDRTRNPSAGDRGYVRPFADHLAAGNGGVRPKVVNLALNGETTTSYSTGRVADRASPDGIFLNTNYARFAPDYPSQRDLVRSAVAGELAAGNAIRTVTVQLGANDLSNAAEAPGFLGLTPADQQAEIVRTLGRVQANYVGLLGDLRALLPAADLYVIGYHNPYGGSPAHPFFGLAAPAVQGLNQVIAGVGTDPAFGGKFVDFYPAVLGRERELTLIDRFPADPVNYVHLNDEGYRVVAGELIRAAPVPAPGGLVLGTIGAAGLAGLSRRRRAG